MVVFDRTRHGRARHGHLRTITGTRRRATPDRFGVDGRDKPGHDEGTGQPL
jgi:hypothetical protein